MRIAKTTLNGAGANTFGYTLSSAAPVTEQPSPATNSITVTGAATVTSTTVHTVRAGGDLTIAEATVPAGWPANPVNVVCTDATSPTPNANIATQNGNAAVIPASALALNADITCTFTNALPTTLRVTKVSNGGTATFGFSGTNGIANHNITTTAAGAPGTAGTTQTLTTPGISTTITEAAPPAGWTLASIACTVNNGTTTAPATGTAALVTRTFTLSAADTAPGNTIACTFTNSPPPTITLTKVMGSARLDDLNQFTVQLRTGSATGTVVDTPGNETTSGTGSNITAGRGTTGTFTATAGTQYFLTEVGSNANLADYDSTITCTDANGVQTGLPTNAPLGASVTPVAGAAIQCTLTNTKKTFPPFVCGANTLYTTAAVTTTGSNQIMRLDPATGATTPNGTLAFAAQSFNALALPPGGGTMWMYNGTTQSVVSYDPTTATVTSFPASADGRAAQMGAINPVNGLYYFATSLGGGAFGLYAFNPGSNTFIGQVGVLTGLISAGDMAFDSLGNLYAASSATGGGSAVLVRYDAVSIPTTAGTGNISGTQLTTLPTTGGSYASVAFDSTGAIVIGGVVNPTPTGGFATRVNPSTGAIISSITNTQASTDYASCNYPNSLRVQKNLPNGRVAPGDQFQLTINGANGGNVGTTTGTETGIQNQAAAEIAGPILLLDGATQTITEAASGTTNLAGYASNWSCVDASNGNAQVASGTGTTGSVPISGSGSLGSNVLCTFTNTPPPRLTVTKISNGGTATFGFSGTNGIAAHNITTTAAGGAGTAGAQQTLTAADTATAITENAPPAGWTLASATCTVTPPGGTAAPAAGAFDAASRTFNLTAADTAGGNVIACTFTNNRAAPLLTVTKVSNGGTATFGFSGTNGIAAHSIATTAAGAPGTAGAQQTLTAAGTATAISEDAPPAGWALSNAACTVTPPGGTAAPAAGAFDAANRSFNLTAADTAAGNVIACTFTNDRQPVLTLAKTVVNDNGGTAVDTAWTLTATGPATISGTEGQAAITGAAVPAGTYTLSETGGPAGYALTGWACTNGVTVNASNQITLALGQTTVCTATNDDQPARLTLIKTVARGTAAATAWTLTATGPTNLSGTSGTAAVTNAAVTPGTYTLAEANGPAGYAATGPYSCVVNGAAAVVGNNVTLAVNDTAVCTITNSRPRLRLVKALPTGRAAATDQFALTILGNSNGTATSNTANTTGATNTPTNTAEIPAIDAGSTYTLREAMAAGSASPIGSYVSTYSCTNATAASATPMPTNQTGTEFTLTPAESDDITCTFSNTRRPATLTITKITQADNGGGPFNFVIQRGAGGSTINQSLTTTAAGASGAATGATITLTAGAFFRVTETVPAAYSVTDANCVMTRPDGSTRTYGAIATSGIPNEVVVPTGDVQAGSTTACTFTNTRRPTLQLTKITVGAAGGPFSFTATNSGFGTLPITTTAAGAPGTTAAARPINVGFAGNIVEAAPPAGWVFTDAACTVTTPAGVTTQAQGPVNVAARSFPLTAQDTAAGNVIACTFTNQRQATLQLAKAWAAGSIAGNQVTIGATTGGANNTAAFNATAPTAADSGAPVVVNVGDSITLPAETGTDLANYTTTVACTGGHTLSGTDGQQANTLTITSGAAAVCTYTNTPRTATLQLAKAWAAGSTAGHQVSIGATTGGTNNTAAFNATAPNAADSGAAVVVTIGDTITLPAEGGANAANYATTLACTGGHTLSGTDGQQANTLTITSANAAVCTYTNTLRTADLSVTKTNTPAGGPSDQANDTVVGGTVTTYRLVVTNHGTGPITGAVVTDAPAAGLTCAAGNPVTITGNGVPPGSFTVADLTGAGIVLGQLDAGQSATLSFDCTVN